MTRARAWPPFVGGGYGSFHKGGFEHEVEDLTQPQGYGAFTGGRYGSFQRPVGRQVVTYPRVFGAFSGMRYGSFAGRHAMVVTPTPPQRDVFYGGGSPRVAPRELRGKRERRREEEAMLLVGVL